MTPVPARRADRRRPTAFTLIEMLAVLLIFSLLAAVVLPNLSVRSGRLAMDEARALASTLEFARERAVVTGSPQRVVLDLDQGAWWVEEIAPAEDAEEGAEGPEPAAPPHWSDLESLPLSAPTQSQQAPTFQPLAGPLGSPSRVREEVLLDHVESGGDSLRSGRTWLEFDADGTAEPADLALVDADGRTLWLRVLPLADQIRITHEAP